MTQEFVTLPREVVERALAALDAEDPYRAAIALRAALEQPQVEQEPVAEHELKDVRCECCGYMTHHREHMGCIRVAQPKREPLTEELVMDAFCTTPNIHQFVSAFKAGVRFAERAHGIE